MLILRLPDELLLEIGNFLTYSDLGSFVQIHKKLPSLFHYELALHQTSSEHYGNYALRDEHVYRDLHRLIREVDENPKIIQHVKELTIDCLAFEPRVDQSDISLLEEIVTELDIGEYAAASVRRLIYYFQYTLVSVAVLLLYMLPNLNKLVFSINGSLVDNISRFLHGHKLGRATARLPFARHLQRLHITNGDNIPWLSFLSEFMLLCSLPNLIEVNIEGMTIYSQQEGPPGYHRPVCARLKSLEFARLEIQFDHLLTILEGSPALERLSLALNCDLLTPEGVQYEKNDFPLLFAAYVGEWLEEAGWHIVDVENCIIDAERWKPGLKWIFVKMK